MIAQRDDVRKIAEAVGEFIGSAGVATLDGQVDGEAGQAVRKKAEEACSRCIRESAMVGQHATWAQLRAMLRAAALEVIKMLDATEGRN